MLACRRVGLPISIVYVNLGVMLSLLLTTTTINLKLGHNISFENTYGMKSLYIYTYGHIKKKKKKKV